MPGPPDLSALAAGLDRRLAMVNRLLRSGVPSGRSVTALLTLRRLAVDGPTRISDLATAESVAQPTMTVLVRRLEQEGLVERAADPADARAVLVGITARGREELTALRDARAELLRRRMTALDPAQLAALEAALPALDALLAAGAGTGAGPPAEAPAP